MKLNYKGLFSDWEIAVAKNLITKFRETQPCLQREGVDDLLQECLTHWFFVRTGYESGREASKQTYMGRVIRNKLTDIVREQEADKRKISHLTFSLNEPLGDHDDSDALEDSIADKQPAPYLQFELKIDLNKVLEKLSGKQQKLCHLLGPSGLSIKEASEHLNTPRTTIYDEIERIRKIFVKEGLEEYLK
jgi:RNA polymerase sigma-70 factor (ECF subfamily)